MDNLDKRIKEVLSEDINVPNHFTKTIERSLDNKKEVKKRKFKVQAIAAVFALVIVSAILVNSVSAQISFILEYKEFENRERVYGVGTIKQAIDSGYNENIDMEYSYKDNIGIKIDSLMISDNDFNMTVNFCFENGLNINTNYFSYGYAIYDDQNNIYAVFTKMWPSKKYENYLLKFYKEQEVSYNKNDVFVIQLADTTSVGTETFTNNNIVTINTLTSSKGFPKSKKLYIKIFDIGYEEFYSPQDIRPYNLSESEWTFEIDIPEKFYDRQNYEYKAKEDIEGFKLEKATVSDTSMTLIVDAKGWQEIVSVKNSGRTHELINENLKIIDQNGNEYFYESGFGATGDKIRTIFAINKNNSTDKMYLHISINGEMKIIELVRE